MKKLLFIFLAFVVIFSNCSKENTNPEEFLQIEMDVVENSISTNSTVYQSENRSASCDRQSVSWVNLVEELNKIANCDNPPPATCHPTFQRENIENFNSFYTGGNLPEIAEYCSSGSCGTCAPVMPNLFSPAEQDQIISAAVQLANNLNHSCGENAEITYSFGIENLLCGPCGTVCSGSGILIERNAFVYVDIEVRCCKGYTATEPINEL